MKELVELLGRYSNPDHVSRLQRILAGGDHDPPSNRTIQSLRKQTQVRLTDEQLDAVIVGYQDGPTLTELSSAFGADRRTLASRLDQRGIQRRGRKLSDDQIQEAIALYADGWSLARIADHFDVYPQSIRYRLRRAGVTLRPRPGS